MAHHNENVFILERLFLRFISKISNFLCMPVSNFRQNHCTCMKRLHYIFFGPKAFFLSHLETPIIPYLSHSPYSVPKKKAH